MTIHDPIRPSLQQMLQTEKLTRIIKECQSIDTIREIAIELLALYQKKSAVAEWATKRAAEAEYRALKIHMIK